MPDWFGNKESGDVVAKSEKKPERVGKHRDPNGERAPRRVKVIYDQESPTAGLDQSKIDKIRPGK